MHDVGSLAGAAEFETPEIEVFENPVKHYDYFTRTTNKRFITKCPITEAEDYTILTVEYKPKDLCIEHRSLRRYMASFRDKTVSHEALLARIMDDVLKACDPYSAVISADCEVCEGTTTQLQMKYDNIEAIVDFESKRFRENANKNSRTKAEDTHVDK